MLGVLREGNIQCTILIQILTPKTLLFLFGTACLTAVWSPEGLGASISPVNLTCDSWQSPLGIDDSNPHLSWQVVPASPGARGLSETAYEIQVASSSALLAGNSPDLWDSGKVVSAQPFYVAYGGIALASAQQVFWQVRIWDQNGQPSVWSPVAAWTMGLLNNSDWKGQWLTFSSATTSAMPIFRRQFTVNPGLQRALVYICGLGQYELSANGVKVGNDLMAPGWTMYNKTCLYDTFDVTACLTNGNNALGVMLGNGMYNVQPTTNYTKFTGSFGPPTLIAQLYLFYTNGANQVIPTDTNWLATSGPITYSHVYGGEFYDARLWKNGWNEAGFNTSGWSAATMTNGPGGILRGQSRAAPPIVVVQTLQPVQTNILSGSTIVYDLGQNATIVPTLVTHGQAGAIIQITPAEEINSDGTVNRSSVGGGTAFWQYTLAGTGSETWMPRFFYHGCRFIQVALTAASGSSQLPAVDNLSGLVIQSASTNTGNFSCSFDLFNKIRTATRWAQANNQASILTDCPHRERLGWLEEGNLNGPSLRYEWDMRLLVAKDLQDMADSQNPSGLVPDIVPELTVFSGGYLDSPEWGSSVILLPWQQYLFTGDDTLMRNYYSEMTNYFDYLKGQASGNFLNYPNGLGDWYDIGPNPPGYSQNTPISLTADAYYCQDAQILGLIAAEIGKTNDAAQFNLLASNIGAAFNSAYYSAANGYYSTGSQTAQSMPLYLGIVRPTNQASVLASLIADINSQGLTTGEIGHRYMLRALTDNGRPDVVFNLHSGSNDPGYGYILSQGNTSLTEAWDGNPGDSLDHFMLGHIVEWFYHDLAGIQWDQTAPGFKHLIIKPAFVGNISWVNASYDGVLGPIVSDWTLTNNQATLSVAVPVGSTASVYLPILQNVPRSLSVTESGIVIWQNGVPIDGAAAGVAFNQLQGSGAQTCMEWTVNSGSYQFAWNVFLPPTGLTAIPGNNRVGLSWNASSGASSYNVKRVSFFSGGPYATIANVQGTNYNDLSAANDNLYYYVVSSVNANDESANSSQVRASPGIQTNYFNFSPTALAADAGPSNPSNGLVTINGSSLLAGDAIVLDVTVVNTSGTTGDNWGAVNLNEGGFYGLTSARLGVLLRTGTGSYPCQIYTNGVAGANFPGTSEVGSNRLLLTLFVAATGSATNLGWEAQIDQGLTGSFTSTLTGTNLTFPGNIITLTFSAYQAAESFLQYPIPVNTNPPVLAWQFDGNQVQFAWPQDHIGWKLQVQTNLMGTNWATVSGSNSTNEYAFPVETSNHAVFFRLCYP